MRRLIVFLTGPKCIPAPEVTVPSLAYGNHPSVLLPGTREDDRGNPRLAQRGERAESDLVPRIVSFTVSLLGATFSALGKRALKTLSISLRSGELSWIG
jgi:hypothetical protein